MVNTLYHTVIQDSLQITTDLTDTNKFESNIGET